MVSKIVASTRVGSRPSSESIRRASPGVSLNPSRARISPSSRSLASPRVRTGGLAACCNGLPQNAFEDAIHVTGEVGGIEAREKLFPAQHPRDVGIGAQARRE